MSALFQNLKEKVQKQNAVTREHLQDLREKVIDVKLAAKLGIMNLKAGVGSVADDTLDLVSALNPLAFRRAEGVRDEEEVVTEESKAAKVAETAAKKAAHAAKVAAALGSLPPAFFQPLDGGADPLRELLGRLPPAFTEEALREEEERLANVVSVASSELSAKVLENYSALVEGIGHVGDVMTHLQAAVIVAKNARRTLARADGEVSAAITVGKGTRQKGALLAVLDLLSSLAAVLGVEATLRTALAQQRYADAVLAYAEAHAQLSACGDLAVAAPVRDGMAGLLYQVVARVEEAAGLAVQRFDPAAWPATLEAYVLLGEEVKPLGDRLGEAALRSVELATDGPLAAAAAAAAAAADGRKLAFKELAKALPKEAHRACLGRTLAAAFDALASLHAMHAWHRARFEALGGVWKERAPPAPPAPKWVPDPASGYFYDSVSGCHFDPKTKQYYHPQQGAWSPVGPPPPGAEPAAEPARTGDEPPSPGHRAAAAAAAAAERHKSGQEGAGMSAMAAGEMAACESAALAIDRCRRAAWELAANRCALLLAAPCAPGAPGILRLHAVCRSFAACGEGFASVEAAALRQHIAAASNHYFEAMHRQRLAALTAKLGGEAWTALPGDTAAVLLAGVRDAAVGLPGCSRPDPSEPAGAGPATAAFFAAAVAEGNPFSGAGDAKGRAWDSVAVAEAANAAAVATAAAADAALQGVLAQGVGLAGPRPVVTASSQYAFTILAEYLRLMRQLKGSPAVLTGITHLFDFALLATFRAFGQQSALAEPTAAAPGDGAPADPGHMTPRLRNTLQRLVQLQASARLDSGEGAHPPALVFNAANLYGLPQRGVATEALACLTAELTRLRPLLKAALPAGDAAAAARLDHFFSHSVAAVSDLREHVYAQVARLLLSLTWLPEAVGDADESRLVGAIGISQLNSTLSSALGKAGKYDLRDVPTENSAWATRLVAEFKAFQAKLAACDLGPEALGAMWDNAASAAAEALLQGFGRVRRCSQEGRALMALDVQVVAAALRKAAPATAHPEAALRAVENYVKAFYTPEAELLTWAQAHPEYTPGQLTALVSQMAHAYKWSKASKANLVAQIEAGL